MKKEELIFTDSSTKSDLENPILGVLEGYCADFVDSTRNGRHYSESLWLKTFSDPLVVEMIENGGIPGELDHPADREEIDSSRIAILMKEKPTKKDGKLWAKFSILNTPLGKIAYTLAKAGFKLGISSRGSGDVYTGADGREEVDEDSYQFKCFDLVLLPSVKSARLNLVTESLVSTTSLKESLDKLLLEAAVEDRELMENTITNLHLFDKPIKEELVATTTNPLIETLKTTLAENKLLKEENIKLQEKLASQYTSDNKNQNRINSLVSEIGSLKKETANMASLLESLSLVNERLANASERSDELLEQLNEYKLKLSTAKHTISLLKKDVEQLDSKLSISESLIEEKDNCINSLNNEISTLKSDIDLLTNKYRKSIAKSNEMVEGYRKISNKAVDKYIESQAVRLGCSVNEIKHKLNESYTFDEIDTACSEIAENKMGINNMSFTPSKKLREEVVLTAKITTTKPIKVDDIDELDSYLTSLLT